MTEADLVVLGDVNPDLVLIGGDVAPAFGQAERVVEEAILTVGGSGAILACGAARLGLRTALVGVVGDDLFGGWMRERLEERSVDVRGLSIDPDRPTGVTVVLSGPEDRALLTMLGTVADLRGELVDRDLVRGARHVHVSSYFLQRALIPDVPELFDVAHDAGVSTSVDPNWDPSGAWDGGLTALLPRVDVFLPNTIEATRLARTSDIDLAIGRLRGAGAGSVVVKAGREGAIAARDAEIIRSPAVPVGVVDTTGAGDSFDAGFLAALLAGEALEHCLAVGNACGALSTRAPGGTSRQPTMAEAMAALEELSVAGRQVKDLYGPSSP